MLQHCVSLESWSQYRGPGQEDQYQRGILKSVKHSQCLKGSIRDFVNQSSQHKCYCGESDVSGWCVVTIITHHTHGVVIRASLSLQSPTRCPIGPDNGLRLFSDIHGLLILLFSNHVTWESESKHCAALHTSLAGPRPHRLITCLFVFVLTNLTHRGRECNKFRNLLNIRIHQRATLGGLGVWPDPLNVNTRSGTRVTKFGKQSQECSEEIPGSGLAWVPIIQIRIDSKRRQGSLLNTNYAPYNEWPSFLSCQPLLQLWA